jgi:hypothetical protein
VTIVFFISGHGFGHASRQVEIINALGAIQPGVRVIIRSDVNPALLARTLKVPYELRPGACDTGIVQASSVSQDDAATVARAIEFYGSFDRRRDDEVRALRGDDVSLVVSDIAPIAFDVAAALNVPSVAIGNFTWDWVYETQPGFEAATWIVSRIRESYAKATLALRLPLSHAFDVFGQVRDIPLVARHATRPRAATRAHFGIPDGRRAVLLSFGGYGLPGIDITRADCLDDWTIVTTDRVVAPPSESSVVVQIAEAGFRSGGFRYEDLVAAVDVVMTKPGYGIIAECIAADRPMLYTSRGAFREYDLLVAEMQRYLRNAFISRDDLYAGRWSEGLRAALEQPTPPERIEANGAEVAAQLLADAAQNGARGL